MMSDMEIKDWINRRIKKDEIDRYLENGRHFIPHDDIEQRIRLAKPPTEEELKAVLAKSLAVQDLTLDDVAALIAVTDPGHLRLMKETALKVKLKVYDNRIVTFAPLYLGSYCVNNCRYCGFKSENKNAVRKVLNEKEIRREIEVLAGKIGHKRLIVVYGEHPNNDVDYIIQSIKTIYSVRVPTKHGNGNIRRVNVNAPPFCIEDLKKLHGVGIGTYQVFQETYHQPTYERMHPQNTIKGNYLWRVYAMHRALDAGIDDVGIGALFGLYDWRFEVMALICHAQALERMMGIGPHTISFPRLEPALNAPMDTYAKYRVSDEDFLKLITIIRLAVPYTGMILTARESPDIRRKAVDAGITQMDASSKISLGGYEEDKNFQQQETQQFILGDTRTLEEVIQELARQGFISSFCTAGYRCGRTGKCIMDLLREGAEGKFCKLNAVLTFREWLDDFASEETRQASAQLIQREIDEVRDKMPQIYPKFKEYYDRICRGERDLFL
ncbi:MAG: [FeFe] hydrogenase H-cluster radical SAM maturase HydG [Candidatus Omnitrophota bacterium]